VNGAFSVLAPILAIVLSLNFGLKVTLTAGGLCYAIALAIVTAGPFRADGQGRTARAADTATAS
jgi:hypothetical protein